MQGRSTSCRYGATASAPHESLLVLDATTGQNALSQAKAFKEVTDVSGIILTKLDGTAKGGIVLAIKNELGIPVKFVGLGEQLDDLQEFSAENYVYGLFADMMNYLYDFYHTLLTDKQRKYIELYYLEDFAFSEIAEELEVTRQAVYDNLKRSKDLLEHYEENLGMYRNFD